MAGAPVTNSVADGTPSVESIKEAYQSRYKNYRGAQTQGRRVHDVCGGSAILLLALLRCGHDIGAYYYQDNDPQAMLVAIRMIDYCLRNFRDQIGPGAVAHAFDLPMDITTVEPRQLKPIMPINVFSAGTPCQGFSVTSRQGKGLQDEKSAIIIQAMEIHHIHQNQALTQGWPYWFCFENVDIPEQFPEDYDWITQTLGVWFYRWDSAALSCAHRVRIYGTNLPGISPPKEAGGCDLQEVLDWATGGKLYANWLGTRQERHPSMLKCNTPGMPLRKAPTLTTNTHGWAMDEVVVPANQGGGTAPGPGRLYWAERNEFIVPPSFVRCAYMDWPLDALEVPGLSERDRNRIVGNGQNAADLVHIWKHLPEPREAMEVADPEEPIQMEVSAELQELAASWPSPPVDWQPPRIATEVLKLHRMPDMDELCGDVPPGARAIQQELERLAIEDPEERDPHQADSEAEGPADMSAAAEDGLSAGYMELEAAARADLEEWSMPGIEDEELQDRMECPTELRDRTLAQFRLEALHALDIPTRTPDHELAAQVEQLVQEIFDTTHRIEEVDVDDVTKLNDIVGKIKTQCLDDNDYKAESYQRHAVAWEALFGMLYQLGLQEVRVTKNQKKVLNWVHSGYRMVFVDIEKNMEGKSRPPRFTKKYRTVTRNLMRHHNMSADQARQWLTGISPKPLHLPNAQSVAEHHGFVANELKACLRSGAIRLWDDLPESIRKGRDRPDFVSPMHVALREKDGKRRLCTNMMYINLWQKYYPIHFESVQDLTAEIERIREVHGDAFLNLSDAKSGYHHVSVDPKYYTYMGIEFQGVYMVYAVLNFGNAQSVPVYCTIETEKHRAFRLLKYQLLQYVDDGARVYGSVSAALWHERRYLRLCTLLGTYFSFGDSQVDAEGRLNYTKIQLYPLRTGEVLGFLLNTADRTITVPEKKLAYILRRIQGWLDSKDYSETMLRKLAGFVVSVKPAVPLGMALVHDCFRALSDRIHMRQVFHTDESITIVLESLLRNLRQWNGKRWYTLPLSLRLESDYSPTGKGGVVIHTRITDGEIRFEAPPVILDHPVCSNFAPDELKWLEDGHMSSVLGEMLASEEMVDIAIEKAPQLVRGFRLVLAFDGQGATKALNKMYSKVTEIHYCIWRIHAKIIMAGGELVAEWIPRTQNVVSDANSKSPDPSSWSMADRECARILRVLLKHAHRPLSIDAFADTYNTKCDTFISRDLVPRCLAVNAFVNGALLCGVDGVTGLKHLVWMNGPWDRMADVIALIRQYKIDCVLVYPQWPHSWHEVVDELPVVGPRVRVRSAPGIFKPGHRVPKKSVGKCRYSVHARLIVWPPAA